MCECLHMCAPHACLVGAHGSQKKETGPPELESLMRSPELKINTQKGCKCLSVVSMWLHFLFYHYPLRYFTSIPCMHAVSRYRQLICIKTESIIWLYLYFTWEERKKEDKRREGKERREEREGKGRFPEMNPRLSFCLHSFVHLYLFCSWYLRAGSVSIVRPMQPSFPFQRSVQLTVSPPLLSTPPLGSAVTSKDS